MTYRRSLIMFIMSAFLCVLVSPASAENDLSWSLARGKNSVGGKVAIRTADGRTQVRGGEIVTLFPYTTKTRLFLEASAQQISARKPGTPADDPAVGPDLAKYVRRERTRSDGSFEFDNLPAGTWVLRGRLSVSFPRVVEITMPTVVTVDGQQIAGSEARRATVFDYTYAWFDSKPVTVRNGQFHSAEFHLVARQDRTDPRT